MALDGDALEALAEALERLRALVDHGHVPAARGEPHAPPPTPRARSRRRPRASPSPATASSMRRERSAGDGRKAPIIRPGDQRTARHRPARIRHRRLGGRPAAARARRRRRARRRPAGARRARARARRGARARGRGARPAHRPLRGHPRRPVDQGRGRGHGRRRADARLPARAARARRLRRLRQQAAARAPRRRAAERRRPRRCAAALRGLGLRRDPGRARAAGVARRGRGRRADRHRQRHDQLHAHARWRATAGATPTRSRRRRSSATPRPTRPRTSAAPTRPPSSRSWPRSRSTATCTSTTCRSRASTPCTTTTWRSRTSSATPSSCSRTRASRTTASPPASAPVLVPHEHPLARVSGSFNAVMLRGREIREITLQGPGAGGAETATAVIGDLLSVLGPRPAGEVATAFRELPLEPPSRARSPLYVHLEVNDRPGVLARIAARFGDRGISLGAMIQRPAPRRPGLARLPHPPGLRGERRARPSTRSQRSTSATASRASCACSPRERERRASSRAATGAGCSPHSCATRSAPGVGLVALPWLVLDAGGDASTAGLVAVFGLVPYVLFGLFAGVTGDRRSRKRVIIAAHSTQTACALAVPLWAISGATPEWLVLGVGLRDRHRAHVRRRGGLRRDRADRRPRAVRARPGPALDGLGDRDGERPGARRPADRGVRPEPRDRGAVRRVRRSRRVCAFAIRSPLRPPTPNFGGIREAMREGIDVIRDTPMVRRITLTTLALEPRVLRLRGADRAVPARRHRPRRPARRLGARRGRADRHRHRAADHLARGPHRRRRS